MDDTETIDIKVSLENLCGSCINTLKSNLKAIIMMKKYFITIIATFLSLLTRAYDAYLGGVYYNFNKTEKTASVTYSSWDRYLGRIDIPESVAYENITYKVTSVGSGAFWNCSDLTSVNIPNTVNYIGDNAFRGCINLTSISIPSSVTSIECRAFENTGWYNNQPDGLLYLDNCLIGYKGKIDEDITIEEGTRVIAADSFLDCVPLTFISIPQSVVSIGREAFLNCSSLINIEIPDGVTTIDVSCFQNCSSLITVKMGQGVTSIGAGAFKGCTGLTTVNIPAGVKYIGGRAFYDCSSLTCPITIPGGVTSIDEATFYNCRMTSVYINDGVTSIGDYAFESCLNLTSISISNTVRTIGKAAFCGCYSLSEVYIPKSVTTIGESAFCGCNKLENLTLPEGLKIIKKSSFSGCWSLNNLIIPSTIKYIYGEAFAGCNKIQKVIVLPEDPPFLYDNSFSNYDITLSVPKESKEKYKNTDPWNKFKYIETLSGDDLEKEKCSIPQISFKDGKLSFICNTEGVNFVSNITDVDIGKHYEKEINLTATYIISVYATKSGYDSSDLAYATLCWIESEPNTDSVIDGAACVRTMPMLIQNLNDTLIISGVAEGVNISVFDFNGRLVSSTKSLSGSTFVKTNLQRGDIGIVKIGDRAIKVQIR